MFFGVDILVMPVLHLMKLEFFNSELCDKELLAPNIFFHILKPFL
jgi:hypothetical protein